MPPPTPPQVTQAEKADKAKAEKILGLSSAQKAQAPKRVGIVAPDSVQPVAKDDAHKAIEKLEIRTRAVYVIQRHWNQEGGFTDGQ
jgi:hypothetical protein